MLRTLGACVLLVLIILSSGCAGQPAAPRASAKATMRAFVQPEMDHQVVLEFLNGAKQSIRMAMFLLNDKEVLDALMSARRRGVDVRVLLDAQPTGTAPGNRPAIKELEAANVSVKTGNPAYRFLHEKVIVVDERSALIMTLDQTRDAFTKQRQYGIIDPEPEVIAEIVAVFDADWNRTTPSVSNPSLAWSPINARQRILELIDSAKQTIDIQVEQMQDREVEDHLIAAAQRRVQVRVVMSPAQSLPDPNAKGQERLKKGGVNLRFVKIPLIRAKLIVVDNTRAFVGSQDFTPASLDIGRGLGIIVTEPTVVGGLQGTFMGDWNIGK